MTEVLFPASPSTLDTLKFENRVSKSGKVLGARLDLVGPRGSVADIKAELLAADPTLKGRKLKAKMNSVRRGDAPLAWVTADAAYSALRAKGVMPVVLDRNKKGDKFAMKFEMLSAAPAEVEAKAISAEEQSVLEMFSELKKQGLTIEDIRAALGKSN